MARKPAPLGFKVIVDSREQQPLNFTAEDMETAALKTGDYTIKGLEHVLCVERKGSLTELYGNIFDERFERELVRMQEFPEKYIVLEFPFSQILGFPHSTNIPRKKFRYIKCRPDTIIRRITEIQTTYGVQFVFCDSKNGAYRYVRSLLKRVYEKYKETIQPGTD